MSKGEDTRSDTGNHIVRLYEKNNIGNASLKLFSISRGPPNFYSK